MIYKVIKNSDIKDICQWNGSNLEEVIAFIENAEANTDIELFIKYDNKNKRIKLYHKHNKTNDIDMNCYNILDLDDVLCSDVEGLTTMSNNFYGNNYVTIVNSDIKVK